MSKLLNLAGAVLFVALPASVAYAQNYTTINGDILQINVSENTQYQVYHRDVGFASGFGQFYDAGADLGQSGVFVVEDNQLYGPLLGGTAYTSTSVSAVSGTGSSAAPYVVTTSGDLSTKLRLEQTVSYVNGDNFFRQTLTLENLTSTELTADVYWAADLYLANSDDGIPFYENGAPGGKTCSGVTPEYTIQFYGLQPTPDAYVANEYDYVWNLIRSKQDLDNSVASGCIDNGVAIQWQDIVIPANGRVQLKAGTSYGDIASIPPVATTDTATTGAGNATKVSVLDNDATGTNPLDTATLTVITAPNDGTTTVNSDGTITYTPDAGFSGMDTFTYQICDTQNSCTEAVVNVTVNAPAVIPTTKSVPAVGLLGLFTMMASMFGAVTIRRRRK